MITFILHDGELEVRMSPGFEAAATVLAEVFLNFIQEADLPVALLKLVEFASEHFYVDIVEDSYSLRITFKPRSFHEFLS